MSKKSVLVVDDAPLMRMVIMNMLKDDPHLDVVGKAKNGAEALKMLPALKPDLILLDMEMPLMDGLTCLRPARSTFGGKIHVLSAVTGLGSAKAVEATKLGADGIVTKPSGNVSLDLESKRGSQLVRKIYELLAIG